MLDNIVSQIDEYNMSILRFLTNFTRLLIGLTFSSMVLTYHRKCMWKFLQGHTLLVYSWMKAPFILTIPAFEGLHDNNYTTCSYKMYSTEVIQGK